MSHHQYDPLDAKHEVMKAARYMRLLTRIAAIVLPLGFVWLKFRGIDFTPISKNISADVIFKCTLAAYYFCWVGGLMSDTSDQEYVFVKPPSRRHVIIGGTSFGALLTAVFGILCFVNSWSQFAVFLALFMVINILGFLYLVRFVLPTTFNESVRYYREKGRYAKLEALNLVYNEYMCGRWQWMRFLAGGVIVGVMNWLSLSYRRGQAALHFGALSVDVELLISLAVLLFVVVMETWIWIMRIRVKAGLSLLDDLHGAYQLAPMSASSAARES